jgi:hypothetical protein
MNEAWPWIALLGMGAVHGLNPGMGWLFAVALGCQEGSARAVWRALPPLALGHAWRWPPRCSWRRCWDWWCRPVPSRWWWR